MARTRQVLDDENTSNVHGDNTGPHRSSRPVTRQRLNADPGSVVAEQQRQFRNRNRGLRYGATQRPQTVGERERAPQEAEVREEVHGEQDRRDGEQGEGQGQELEGAATPARRRWVRLQAARLTRVRIEEGQRELGGGEVVRRISMPQPDSRRNRSPLSGRTRSPLTEEERRAQLILLVDQDGAFPAAVGSERQTLQPTVSISIHRSYSGIHAKPSTSERCSSHSTDASALTNQSRWRTPCQPSTSNQGNQVVKKDDSAQREEPLPGPSRESDHHYTSRLRSHGPTPDKMDIVTQRKNGGVGVKKSIVKHDENMQKRAISNGENGEKMGHSAIKRSVGEDKESEFSTPKRKRTATRVDGSLTVAKVQPMNMVEPSSSSSDDVKKRRRKADQGCEEDREMASKKRRDC